MEEVLEVNALVGVLDVIDIIVAGGTLLQIVRNRPSQLLSVVVTLTLEPGCLHQLVVLIISRTMGGLQYNMGFIHTMYLSMITALTSLLSPAIGLSQLLLLHSNDHMLLTPNLINPLHQLYSQVIECGHIG